MLKTYAVSLAVGILAGVIYAVLDVNSPAPPIIALVGLLGMQIGEHLIPLIKRLINRQPVNLHWFRHDYHHKIGDNPPPSGDKTS
jgi:XapX domain-containing protein